MQPRSPTAEGKHVRSGTDTAARGVALDDELADFLTPDYLPADRPMIDDFNQAADDERLRSALRECCAAASWVDRIIAGRPYPDEAALLSASDAATAELDDTGLDEALAGHPRIGERAAAGHSAWSRHEQSGVAGAGDDVRAELAEANAAYEQEFGHVYLVCATGKSAEEMLVICRSRLTNDPDTERGVVRIELASINRLRLGKLLHPEGER